MIRKINGVNLRNFTDGDTYRVANTTGETIAASIFITANTFKANDWITLDGCFERTIGTATITAKFYWNTTLNITGAIQIASENNSPLIGQTRPYWEFSRRLSIRTANGGGSGISLGTALSATGATGGRNEYTSQASDSNISIDWTTDGYLFSTIAMNNSTSTARQQFFKLWTY